MQNLRWLNLLARPIFTLVIVALAIGLLAKGRLGPSAAYVKQPAQDNQITLATRRVFDNRVPQHLPIKVSIKRDKDRLFRDLNNDNWARDFQIEVKNTGDKPIYFLLPLSTRSGSKDSQ
jgi:hypothetical protein